MDQPGARPLRVTSADHGRRVDVFLCQELGLSRRDVRELMDARGVQVTLPGLSRPSFPQKGALVVAGSELLVDLACVTRALPDSDTPLEILLETPDLLGVNKPAGTPSGATRQHNRHNIASAALARFPEIGHVGASRYEPGLLHRLDTQTSGALLLARNQKTFARLREVWASRVKKKYLAVGRASPHAEAFAPGVALSIRSSLSPDPSSEKRVVVSPGERYQTTARVVHQWGRLVLLDVEVGAAYRHQIRAHLAQLGLPLVGDSTYGAQDEHAPRHALHAYYVACEAEPAFRVVAPLPADLKGLLGSELASTAASILSATL